MDWNYNKEIQIKKTEKKDEDGSKKKRLILTEHLIDFLFRLYLLSGGIHYSFDSLVKIYYYGFQIIYKECKLWYFIHHVATLVNFRSLWMLDHYPWFMMFPPAYHTVLVAFPDFWLNNYVYGIALASYIIHILFVKTFRENRVY